MSREQVALSARLLVWSDHGTPRKVHHAAQVASQPGTFAPTNRTVWSAHDISPGATFPCGERCEESEGVEGHASRGMARTITGQKHFHAIIPLDSAARAATASGTR